MTFANALVALLLRSPLHRLMSGRFMLISVTGLKSGRTFTTPVNYVRDGHTVTVISRRGRTWWKNLSPPAPVRARIRGKEYGATGEVLPLSGTDLVDALEAWYRGMGLRTDRAKIQGTADDRVVVRLTLGDAESTMTASGTQR